MEILISRIDNNHRDSFWYDGLIATAGEYRLYAAGDIRFYQEDKDGNYIGMYDGKARDGFVEPKDDKELEQLYGNENGYRLDMNNWFEVVNEDGDCVGDIYYSYDDGIEWLKEVSNGKY